MQPVRTAGRPAMSSSSIRSVNAAISEGSGGGGDRLRGSTQEGRSGSLQSRSSRGTSAAKRTTRTGSRGSRALDHQELLIHHLLREGQDVLVDRLRRSLVLGADRRHDPTDAMLAVAQLPDAGAHLVEGVVLSAVEVQ